MTDPGPVARAGAAGSRRPSPARLGWLWCGWSRVRPAATVHVPDLTTDARWPHFGRVAAELGVRGVLAVGLPVSFPGGVLNLYSSEPDAFDEDARELVTTYAHHAAIALSGARRLGKLHRAIESRDLIGQAKGVLILRHGITAESAFEMLVEASQTSNMKLVEVARWVVGNAAAL